jgi:hypothetical protein
MTTHSDEQKSWVETVDNIAALETKKDGDTVGFEEGTDEEKKLVRKIDLFLMPTIWVLYCFSYMDRTNIVSKSSLTKSHVFLPEGEYRSSSPRCARSMHLSVLLALTLYAS